MSTASDSPEIAPIDPTVSPTPPPPQTEPLRSELSRQVSIYSLTLDEIQNTLCDPGKNFGSMNMDEFICNIWTAEEASQAMAAAAGMSYSVTADSFPPVPLQPQPSLPRQGSLTLPPPLCRKTVEEVWADIHHVQPQEANMINGVVNASGGGNQRQPTLGEMTLEDFLIKAGIVRQGCPAPQPYTNDAGGATALNVADFGHGNIALHYPDTVGVVAGTQEVGGRNPVQLAGVNPGYPIRTGRPRPVTNGCPVNPIAVAPPAIAVPAAGGYVNGGYAQMACGSPASPLSLDGMCNGHVENSGLYGMEMKGKKRTLDGGPVEKVVERRQRRMIKNRESAARSRARKQAYTVELEAELKLLREENSNLLHEQKEEKEMKQQQWLDMLNYLMQHPPTQPRSFLYEKGLKKVRSW